MSLEEAMAEVRRYLDVNGASPRATSNRAATAGAAPGQPRQFALLGSSIARLSQVSATYGQIEPNGKGGAFGSYLKRIIRKAVGWYSRPMYEFDRTVIEAFEQTRLDMLGLQQQINALATDERQPTQRDLLRSVIELLFVNIATVQSLRQALQNERPEFQQRFEELLKTSEDEISEMKNALLELLPPGPAQDN
jgi:signal transduction histidine kinase